MLVTCADDMVLIAVRMIRSGLAGPAELFSVVDSSEIPLALREYSFDFVAHEHIIRSIRKPTEDISYGTCDALRGLFCASP